MTRSLTLDLPGELTALASELAADGLDAESAYAVASALLPEMIAAAGDWETARVRDWLDLQAFAADWDARAQYPANQVA